MVKTFNKLYDHNKNPEGSIQGTGYGNKQKAIETYKKLLLDYPGSLFSDEARKRYRVLRGDKIVDDSNPEYRKWNN